jgi:hypothetical protein
MQQPDGEIEKKLILLNNYFEIKIKICKLIACMSMKGFSNTLQAILLNILYCFLPEKLNGIHDSANT